MNKLKRIVRETGKLLTLQENIPDWITSNEVYIDFDQCFIHPNTDGGYSIISNELQCSLASASTYEECQFYLLNKVSPKVVHNMECFHPYLRI